jgi:hypothetical protein
MATWDERRVRVSRAFDEWRLIDRDQRTFLALGLAFAGAVYDHLWKESGEEPYIEDGPDQLESFEEKVGGLHQHDFDWYVSGVMRDGVTNFELYLEKAREEILQHHGTPFAIRDRSPEWGQSEALLPDVVIETEEVRGVRSLRHFLTHRRGELRTEELRKGFQETHTEMLPAVSVELDQERAIGFLDVLAEAVRSIDPSVYEHTWGGRRVARLRS